MAQKAHTPSSTLTQATAEPNQAAHGLEVLRKRTLKQLGVKYDLMDKATTESLDKTRTSLLNASFPILFNNVQHDLKSILTTESINHYRQHKKDSMDQEDARYSFEGRLRQLTDTLCDIQLKYALGIDTGVTSEILEKNIDMVRDSIERLFEETDPSIIRNFKQLRSEVSPHFDKRVFAAKCVTASREAVVRAISTSLTQKQPKELL